MSALEVLRLYPQSDFLTGAYGGSLLVPKFSVQAPPDLGLSCPPRVIPIWSVDAWRGYIGVVYSGDFGGVCFCQCFCEGWVVDEIAKTPQQLKLWLAYRIFCNSLGDSRELAAFCDSAGLGSYLALEREFSGLSDVDELARLPEFSSDLPLAFCGGGISEEMQFLRSESSSIQSAWMRINVPDVGFADRMELINQIERDAGNRVTATVLRNWRRAFVTNEP